MTLKSVRALGLFKLYPQHLRYKRKKELYSLNHIIYVPSATIRNYGEIKKDLGPTIDSHKVQNYSYLVRGRSFVIRSPLKALLLGSFIYVHYIII